MCRPGLAGKGCWQPTEEEDGEDGEASEEGERTALSREEAPSARSPPHRRGSRHPL